MKTEVVNWSLNEARLEWIINSAWWNGNEKQAEINKWIPE